MGLKKGKGLNYRSGEDGNSVVTVDVTDSGNELPSVSGYELGDTFLDIVNQKLYTVDNSGVGYGLNSEVREVGDSCLDVNTGNLSGFTTTKYPFIPINSNDGEIVIPFETANDVSTYQAILSVIIWGGAPEKVFDIVVQNGKLTFWKGYPDFEDTEIGSVSANTKYVIKIDKAVSSNASHIKLYAEDGTLLSDVTYNGFSANVAYYFGVSFGYSVYSPFAGTILYAIGNDKLSCIGQDIVVNVNVPDWNNGEDLVDGTIYNDTTNNVSYFYNNGILYSEGGGSVVVETLNMNKTGNPTISDDFIVSGFSDNNYLSFPIVDPCLHRWKIKCKFKLTQLTNCVVLQESTDQHNFRLSVGKNMSQDQEINLLVSGAGGVWVNMIEYKTGIIYNNADEWWWLEFGLDENNHIYIDRSLNGKDYVNMWRSSGTYNNIKGWDVLESVGNENDSEYLVFDAKEYQMYIDSLLMYQGTIKE